MRALILIALLMVPNNMDDNRILGKSKVEFNDYPIITANKQVICYLSQNKLFFEENSRGIEWWFQTRVTAIKYYPINHRQYFEIKLYGEFNQFIDKFKIKLWIHCEKSDSFDIVHGKILFNSNKHYRLPQIYKITFALKPTRWYKCGEIL